MASTEESGRRPKAVARQRARGWAVRRYPTCTDLQSGTGRRCFSEIDLSAKKLVNRLIQIGSCLLLAFFAEAGAMAAPLDLQDTTPRWIEVQFEVSPEDQPGRLNAIWSVPRAAFLDSDPEGESIRIRIPAREIEAHLRTTGTETITGSFSDFVWTLDSRTGHVLSAVLTGRVRERFSLGLIQTSITVDLRIEMTTQSAAGFRPTKGIFGLRTHSFCLPAPESSRCIAVAPIRFDPESGYVNAVGSVVAAAAVAKIQAFSPLGEARFSEKGPAEAESIISGTSPEDAVCLAAFDRPCRADLGGES